MEMKFLNMLFGIFAVLMFVSLNTFAFDDKKFMKAKDACL